MLPCAAHLHLHLWPCLWLGTHRLAVSHVSLPCPIICAFTLPDTVSAPHLLALAPMTCSFLRKSLQGALALEGAHQCREIQPLETRAAGAGINVASNMLFTFIIGQCFTTMLCSMRYGVFLFFAGMILATVSLSALAHLCGRSVALCNSCLNPTSPAA